MAETSSRQMFQVKHLVPVAPLAAKSAHSAHSLAASARQLTRDDLAIQRVASSWTWNTAEKATLPTRMSAKSNGIPCAGGSVIVTVSEWQNESAEGECIN